MKQKNESKKNSIIVLQSYNIQQQRFKNKGKLRTKSKDYSE